MSTTVTSINIVKDEFQNQDGVIGYDSEYVVAFTGAYSAKNISEATGVPKYNDGRTDDNRVYAQNIAIDLVDGEYGDDDATQKAATVKVRWAMKSLEYNLDIFSQYDIEVGGTDITEAKHYDADGLSVVNSAGDLYHPLPEGPIRGCDITITKNERTNPVAKCVTYSYTTNAAAWFGVVGIGQGCFGKIVARRRSFVNSIGLIVYYWEVTYPIRIKRDGWKLMLLDNGFHKLVGTAPNQKKIKIVAPDGADYTVPQPLDGAGGAIDTAANPDWTPVFFPPDGRNMCDATNWNALNLPNPFVDPPAPIGG